MTIGERIKQARKIRGMSQRELAKRVEVSAQAISKYEREINAPSSGVLLRLSKALGVGVEFFVRPKSVVAITPDYRKRRALPPENGRRPSSPGFDDRPRLGRMAGPSDVQRLK